MKNLNETSFLVVTETWIIEKTEITEFYLCNSHHFVHQPRSSLTNVQRGGGVGIWAPNQFTIKIRNDFTTVISFFESMWIEIGNPLTQKLLINVAYCPNVNLSNFFLDEMTVEISNVYSYTDNLNLFGDYNINLLGVKGRQSLIFFTANDGLCYINETEATWTNSEKYSLIDHCFISKNQIFEANVLESTLGVDHSTIVYQSSSKVGHSDKKRQFLIRNNKKYSRSNFNRDIALQDWSPMYQMKEFNEKFSKFFVIFRNILS